MEQQIEHPTVLRSIGAFLLEAVLLFAVLALPYFVLDRGFDVLASGILAFAYLLWPFVAALIWRTPQSPSWLGVISFACMQFFLGPWVVLWAGALVAWSWIALGYRVEDLTIDPRFISLPSGAHLGIFAVFLFLVIAAIFSVSLLLLRPRKETFGAFVQRLRDGAYRDAVLAPFAALTVGLVAIGIVTMITTIAVGFVMESISVNRSTHFMLDLALLLPMIPAGLFAVAALLAVHRRMIPAILTRIPGHRGDGAATRRGTAGFVLATLAGAVVILGAGIYDLHIGMVAMHGPAAQLRPSMSVAGALDDWVAEQYAAGRTGAEIAAVLRDHGQWMRENPDVGLVTLLPELSEAAAGGSLRDGGCRVSVTADIADPAELRGVKRVGSEQPAGDLKYCLAVTCPAPMIWDADPNLLLYSSHPSQNPYWVANLYVDIFGKGVAGPGGYCTTSGTLSDRFLG